MRLTKFSDYALRVLMLAAEREGRLTIEEASAFYDISRTHLRKVVRHLAAEGLLEASRGRGGGFTLGRAPDQINLGAVLRKTEPDFRLWECAQCRLHDICRLPCLGRRATDAFLAVFDATTLADILPGGPAAQAIALRRS